MWLLFWWTGTSFSMHNYGPKFIVTFSLIGNTVCNKCAIGVQYLVPIWVNTKTNTNTSPKPESISKPSFEIENSNSIPILKLKPTSFAYPCFKQDYIGRKLLRMVDNLGHFSGWWFLSKVKLCHVFQSFGCNSQASWADWICIFTCQPVRHLGCNYQPKKLEKHNTI